ncbi:MAG: type VI secretion system tip protein TssI/VgrG [Gammaproteobacteria bacterium]|nr:type VI secretion system tip protein TssI/VgrG [Gammaproteobacteria bacterium]
MHYSGANISRFTFSIASHKDHLRVYQFKLKEHLSDHFILNLEFVCEDQYLEPEQLLQKTALLTIQGDNEVQYLNGIISAANFMENGTRFARYSVTVVPIAWFLKYRKGCRIFQHLSVPEIITQIFTEAGLTASTHYQWSTDRHYSKRDYCTQYNETEWDFICRLMAEEGIHFHYQHHADRHLMILGDSKTALGFIEQESVIPFHSNSGLTEQEEHINQFNFSQQTHSGKSTLRDYNFKTPGASLEKSRQFEQNQALEDYRYPGQYQNENDAEFYAQLRQEQHNVLRQTSTASSNVQRLRAGKLFTLAGHRYQTNNIDQLIIKITHKGKQPQSLDEDTPSGNNEGSSYQNQFTSIPASTIFRPKAMLEKPLIQGEQNAFVTGPEGEEIYLNEYGQIKVQFLWDREGQQDEKTTCWVRVNHEQAGKSWGHIMPPRIGQQVFVEFEHGNPDRPIVSGRCYNGDSLPPYRLPEHKTRSTVKTNSTPGGEGYNEIRYEDKKSQEQIYFHSEKDLDIRCKNDRREHIGNTRSLIVEQQNYEHIKKDNHQKIELNHQQKIDKDLSQNIGDRQHIQLGQNYLQQAGNEVHIKSASSTVLDAGSEITFKASGGFIKIDPSGVTINGIKVNFNSGGSPGSAAPASPQVPYQATEADKDKPGQSYKAIAPQAAFQLSPFLFAQGSGKHRQLDDDKLGGCKPCAEEARKVAEKKKVGE